MTSKPFPPAVPPDQWDDFVKSQPRAHVLQQSAWGDLKSAYGWSVERVALMDNVQTQLVCGAQLLFRPLPFRLGTMAYLGMGPIFRDPFPEKGAPLNYMEGALWYHIDVAAKKHGAAFLKWEPGIYRDDESKPDFKRLGFQESPQTVQPPNTVLIDINGDEETILARMNQGTRRKIRQSQKNGIRYYEGTRADVAKFNAMMQTTGSRNAFGVHEPGYYELAYDLFVSKTSSPLPEGEGSGVRVQPDATLILAEHEGDHLAGIMVFAAGKTAWYLYGASSDTKRNLMGAYGVQWAAIQWAKARGCDTYDMWGIPDAHEAMLEAQFETRSDGLWGVYGFKRGWGGEVVRSLGAWDKVYSTPVYTAYKLALKVRKSNE
jgi:lipid II:glycine glycyltransferase (peptidoglycan interpeptide bridge formation enzyme)